MKSYTQNKFIDQIIVNLPRRFPKQDFILLLSEMIIINESQMVMLIFQHRLLGFDGI